MLTFQTEISLEGVVTIVKPGVDDFRVARGRFCANAAVAFDQESGGVGVRDGELAGDGETDPATSAGYENVSGF